MNGFALVSLFAGLIFVPQKLVSPLFVHATLDFSNTFLGVWEFIFLYWLVSSVSLFSW